MTRRKWGNRPQQHKTYTGVEPRENLNIVFRLLIFIFIYTIAITLRLQAINDKTNKQTNKEIHLFIYFFIYSLIACNRRVMAMIQKR
jgi:hypothetical protein